MRRRIRALESPHGRSVGGVKKSSSRLQLIIIIRLHCCFSVSLCLSATHSSSVVQPPTEALPLSGTRGTAPPMAIGCHLGRGFSPPITPRSTSRDDVRSFLLAPSFSSLLRRIDCNTGQSRGLGEIQIGSRHFTTLDCFSDPRRSL